MPDQTTLRCVAGCGNSVVVPAELVGGDPFLCGDCRHAPLPPMDDYHCYLQDEAGRQAHFVVPARNMTQACNRAIRRAVETRPKGRGWRVFFCDTAPLPVQRHYALPPDTRKGAIEESLRRALLED